MEPDASALSDEEAAHGASYERATSADELASYVERVAGGDQAALGALYDATARRVHAVALRFVGNRETADEVVMDVYHQVWRDAARYDAGRGQVQTWILLICRSRALDTLRRRDRAVVHPDPLLLVDPEEDPASNPHDLLDAMERGTKLHAALAMLPPLRRQLLALAFFRDYSHSEIASHTGMPLGTVKTHIREGLRQLRESWT